MLIATPYEFFGYGGIGSGSGGGIAAGGGITASKAAPDGSVRPNAKSRALPAPDLAGRAVQAAKGSSIPGLAIVSLSFRH